MMWRLISDRPYVTLKRLTPAVVLMGNKLFTTKPDPSRGVVLTIAVTVLGCLVAVGPHG